MEPVSNPFQACNDIFVRPNRVFATLAERHNWSWLPFFLVMLLALLPTYLYFNFIDFDWYVDLLVNNTMGEVSPAEQDIFRNAMTKETTLYGTFGYVFFLSIVVNAVLAVYLNMVTKMDEENVNGFTDWYGFTWWVSMPILLSSVLAIGVILLADNHQLSPTELSPTSLSYILGLGMDSQWFPLAQNIRLESFWTMYLIAVGVNQWTRLGGQKAKVIAVAPYLALWAIWAFIILI